MFSFFLSILHSVMSDHDGRRGCGTSYLKKNNKKKITIQIFDKATSVKTIYKQSSGTPDRHTKPCPCPTLGHNIYLSILSYVIFILSYLYLSLSSYLILSIYSPDPDLEILLEVNLNFQVRLTIILVFGIFSRGNGSWSFLLKYINSSPFLLVISVPLDK